MYSSHHCIPICFLALSTVVLPNPIMEFNPNSNATLATIGDCGDAIEAAVAIVLSHFSLIYSKLVSTSTHSISLVC